MEHIVGSMLRIRPVIEVRSDGTVGSDGKNFGKPEKSLIDW